MRPSGLLFRLLVERTQLVDHFLEAENLRLLARRRGVARAVDVKGAQFQRVHADLFRQFVHERLAGEEALRGTVSAERGAPCMVGAHRAAAGPECWECRSLRR